MKFRHGRSLSFVRLLVCGLGACCAVSSRAQPQKVGQSTELSVKVQELNEAMGKALAQLEDSQRQLQSLKDQMRTLQQQLAGVEDARSAVAQPAQSAQGRHLQDVEENESIQDSQLATLQQIKLESDSKYPVRVSGLLLANVWVNAENVDNVTGPVLAFAGSGSSTLTLRQTVLGLDARGPKLMGANSYADIRVDFAASPAASATPGIYSGAYGASTSLLRLRTAHAGLVWPNVETYFALDRPMISPNSPASLAAIAEPALSWSGNLWMWSPQIGMRWNLSARETSHAVLEAGIIDVADAPLTPQFFSPSQAAGPNSNEARRWPGVEARIGWASGAKEESNRLGISGLFAAHRYPSHRMESWAGTLDAHWRLPARLEFTGSFYRGLGLGGLGGGAYKDYAFRSYGSYSNFTALDDVGGWAELKERFHERLQVNAAYGTDQLFARQLREYAPVLTTAYQRLARNQTFTANAIFSPSAYLLFSLEYRHLLSAPVTGKTANSNVVVLSAGYKF
jgi:TolA-binding protein